MKKDPQKKAVILITIDALRAGNLKSYGYHRNTAPNIEDFAKNGTIFLNTITNGPESPTAFSSLFTSILPLLDGGYSPLPPQKISLPQLLKENDIHTYAIHSNPNLGGYFNYNRGFDVFLDGIRYNKQSRNNFKEKLSIHLKNIIDMNKLSNKLMYRVKGFNKLKNWLRRKIPLLTDILLPFVPITYDAPYVVNKLISFLKSSEKPYFIWAHFMDVHSPYNPPLQNVLNFRKNDFNISEREFLIGKVYSNARDIKITPKMVTDLQTLYDAEINYIDECLANFIEFIKKRMKKNCLLIITADHGESFYEHELFGHQGSVYEEVLKIPLIIIEMGKNSTRKKVQELAQLIDLAPTILSYFGLEIPDNFQGKNLFPLIKNEFNRRNEFAISECYQKGGLMKRSTKDGFILLAIRNREWKYIFDEENSLEFLFNLELDPLESNNLIKKNNEKAEEFRIIKNFHIKKISESYLEKSTIIKDIHKLELNKL